MRILLSIHHPAWAHQFRYIVKELEKRGHILKVLAIDKDRDLELLDAFGIKYDVISNSSGKNMAEKAMIFLGTTIKTFLVSLSFKPDLYIGRASPMMAINSFLFRKKHIVFADTEHSRFSLFMVRLFSSVIITPDCFKKDLGKKQLRINSYKELAYLHPNYFKPDPSVLSKMGLNENDRFIIVRFISWQAHHDIGQHGFGIEEKRGLVTELEKHGRVLITSESPLSSEFEKYRITLPPEKLHDLLNYATLYIGEGATIASECAVLGTPAIYVNTLSAGTLDEQEERYGLVYNFCDPKIGQKKAIEKAVELLQKKDLKEEWQAKRKLLLSEKINVTQFMVEFIENYPSA